MILKFTASQTQECSAKELLIEKRLFLEVYYIENMKIQL